MKSKEEIIERIGPQHNTEGLKIPCYYKPAVLIAMEEYAEQFKSTWISVKDKLPEEEQIVLAFQRNDIHKEFEVIVLGFFDGKFRGFSFIEDQDEEGFYSSGYYSGIEYWMPLPAPPEVK